MSRVGNAGRFTRGPISTLIGVGLLGNIVWYRSKAKIKKIFKQGGPEIHTSYIHTGCLPQELLDMIIAHILLDTPTLKACSATCRSWYIATLPHLHHTLSLWENISDPAREGLMPLRKLEKMRLLRFVKRLRILQYHPEPWFQPTAFNARSLAHFTALTNVQELGVDEFDLHAFTPRTQLYFGHFTPRLRSLALRRPKGAHHQLLYFLGLFPNLDDFKLIYDRTQELTPGLAPVPRSSLSLRGRLTLRWLGGEAFLRDLSQLSGGLRFRYMDLLGVGGARLLLDTCAETLQTLRTYPVCWTGNRETLLRDLDLSKNVSLRSLEIPLKNISLYPAVAQSFLRDLLSTIRSPVFSDLVIVLEDRTTHDTRFFQHTLFGVVRCMYEVRPFRLVFCLEIWDGDQEDTARMLKRYIDAEVAEGGLEFLPCPPLIVSDTRATRSLAWEGLNT